MLESEHDAGAAHVIETRAHAAPTAEFIDDSGVPRMTDQDPKTQLGYRLYWKRIALHLNLRDIAGELGTTSVALSNFEKGDFTRLTREQLLGYLDKLEMSNKADDYLALMPEALEA
jgi:hypothetical protein